jgi:hypothetical protein
MLKCPDMGAEVPVSGPVLKIRGFPGLRGSILGSARPAMSRHPRPRPPMNCSADFFVVLDSVTELLSRSMITVLPVHPNMFIP